jgi:hypothetical protein
MPMYSFAESCERAMKSTSWGRPAGLQADAGPNRGDNKAFLVGRWAACNGAAPAGVEFGTNNRWRLLARDASGAYVPVSGDPPSSRGNFYLLGDNGQLNLDDDQLVTWLADPSAVEEAEDSLAATSFVEALPDREALRISSGGSFLSAGIYARIAPSPARGWDNPPTLTSQSCQLVGTWDATSAAGGSARNASFAFDGAGNFVGAPGTGADLCATQPMYGTYALTPSAFELTTNVGMGQCQFWFAAQYRITFDPTCTKAQLDRATYDNCTGGRGYFNEPTTLVKRR